MFLLSLILFLVLCGCERVTYISVEHPKILYYNEKYITYANVSSRKYTRNSVMHYFSLSFEAKFGFGNNVTVDIYFYEFLTNQYKPSFVEMHFRGCDMEKDPFFGPGIKSGTFGGMKCPYPKGAYHIQNASIPYGVIPKSFPFSKGRIYSNVTLTYTKELLGSGYIDMELKQLVNVKSKRQRK